jgi:hypothetical protein
VIRVFAPDGTYQTSLGRKGEGPGEFKSLDGAWARGDTIEAFDFGLRRVIRFLPDGSSQTIVLTGGGSIDVAIPGTVGDGWALLRIDAAGTDQRDQMSVQRFDREGVYEGEVAKLEGMLRQNSEAGGGGPPPLSPRARYHIHDGAIYLAETLEPVIRAYGSSGEPLPEIRWDPGTLPAHDEALGAAIDAAVALVPADRAESSAGTSRVSRHPTASGFRGLPRGRPRIRLGASVRPRQGRVRHGSAQRSRGRRRLDDPLT